MLGLFIASVISVLASHPTSGVEQANNDIITVIKELQREIREVKQHSSIQDARENATEKALNLLVEQNSHFERLLLELRNEARDNKDAVERLRKEVRHVSDELKGVTEVLAVAKQTRDEVQKIEAVLTSPLPGKTWRKPTESCDWLNERFFNLPSGKYWTKVDGKPTYQQCTMNDAGIPPVRCSDKPCHADALCEDTEVSVRCTCYCGYVGEGRHCAKSFKPFTKDNGTMLLTSACALQSNTHLTTFKKLGLEYLVKFEVYPRVFERNNAYNILHFTTGEDCCGIGYRMPGVWFRDMGNRLIIISAVNGDGNFYVTGENTAVPLKTWSTVSVRQKKVDGLHYVYSITINGNEVFSTINSQPKEIANVKAFVADGWFPVHQGFIRNLYVEGYA